MEESTFEEDVNKHPLKFLEASYEAIDSFSRARTLTIQEPLNALITNCQIHLSKEEKKDVFDYSLQLSEFVPLQDYHFAKFGFDSPLVLKSDQEFVFLNPKAIISITRTLGDPFKFSGEIDNMNSAQVEQIIDCYLRLVVPVEKDAPTSLFQGTSYTDKKVIYGYGLVSFDIDNFKYDLYRHEKKSSKQHYLILESRTKLDHNTFKNAANAVLKAFSLLCGNWYGGQRYIISSDDEGFKKIQSIHFEKESYSILTDFKIIDSFGFVQYMKACGENLKISENGFPPEALSNMAKKIIHEPALERALSLILEGNHTKSAILKSCSYLVAIETLSGIIAKAFSGHFKPIKRSDIDSDFNDQLKAVLNNFKSKLTSEEFVSVEKKIQNFNSPSNLDKILKSFELFNLKLPKEMLAIIKSRNVFLHGQMPFKEHHIREKGYDLVVNALKMHFLACTLFLKYCGYKGHIKNFAGSKVFNDNKHDSSFVIKDHVYYRI